MKILYVLGFLPTYVKREIETLSEAGVDITVLLPSDDSGNSTSDLWKNITEDPGTGRVRTLRVMPFRFFLCSPFRLAAPLVRSLKHFGTMLSSLLKGELRYFLTASEVVKKLPQESRPNVIHAHFAGNQAHIARILSRLIKVPYTVTTHATDIFTPASIDRLKRVLEEAAAVLTISEYNRKYLRDNNLFNGKVTVAKLGVDVSRLPERTTIHAKPVGVCIASGLVEKKGVDVLLQAADILKKEYTHLNFKIIGSDSSGNILAKYREESRELPVEFTGTLSSHDTLATVADATFFVLPCREAANGDKDGIPVSLMEAMGMGVPSVSTSLSGIPELIEHGKNGYLADPGSPESLSRMIRKILESPEEAETMGIRGMNSILSQHSPVASAETVISVFRGVIEDNLEEMKK